jgi:hypothetical protein
MRSIDKGSEKRIAYLTPSTRKLIEMRKGKGHGMLTQEEIDLLRKSAKETNEVFILLRGWLDKKTTIKNFIGMLADKTDHVATLEEIENAIASGWVQQGLSEKE